MAGDMGVAGRIGVALGLAAGLHAVEEVADVEGGGVAADLLDLPAGQKLRRTEHELAGVAGLHPARLTLEPHGAGAERDPVLLAEDELGPVGIAADDLVALGRVILDRRRAVVHRPLAEIDAVRTPLEHAAALGHAAADEAAPLLEVEAVLERVGIERPPRRGPQVHVPVVHLRVGQRRLGQPSAQKRRHATRVREHLLDLAQPAGAGEFTREGIVRQIAPLGARLEDGAAAPHRVAVDERLGDVLRAGLLAVDVLPRLGGEHRQESVPVGAGRDQHRVDVLAVEHLAEVAVHRAVLRAVLRVGDLLHRLAPALLDVGDRGEDHVGLLEEAAEVVLAAATDADAPDDDPLARGDRAVEPQRRRRDDRRHGEGGAGRQAGLERVTTGNLPARSLHADRLLGVNTCGSRRYPERTSPADGQPPVDNRLTRSEKPPACTISRRPPP